MRNTFESIFCDPHFFLAITVFAIVKWFFIFNKECKIVFQYFLKSPKSFNSTLKYENQHANETKMDVNMDVKLEACIGKNKDCFNNISKTFII